MNKKKIIALIVFVVILIIAGLLYFYLTSKDNKKDKEIEDRNINLTDDGLIFIKGGKFNMGSPKDEVQRENDETLHEVSVNDFYVSAYEVTQDGK